MWTKRRTGECWTNTLPESVVAKEEGKRGTFLENCKS